MAQPTEIQSPLHLRTLLSSTPVVIADFHATWCGPCHAIAPIFTQLSTSNSTSGLLACVKIDVDAQQEIAREYGVSAMPTFLVFKEGKVVETIRGANVPALKAAVEKARREGEEIMRIRKTKEEEARKAKESREEKTPEVKNEETTVSGSYGISKGTGWKMSLT
ncbi:hypothetical protein FKW77_007123 [Venturia effusa]|uniref:Thioredoxin domain-containing protein n=1 Tax=Venturia effusa TaxID=50376 RepID=A0A517LPB8_9PEZI|nr:hypothetical protein FKW77_007123 [Venturia effusa]